MSYKVVIPHSLDIKSMQQKFPNLNFSYEWDHTVSCAIYENNIQEVISLWTVGDKTLHFIPTTTPLDEDLSFTCKLNDYKDLFSFQFKNETVSEVIHIIQKQIEQISLENQFSEFPRYLQTVAVELVQNAIIAAKESHKNEIIILTVKESEDNFEIEIKDSMGTLHPENVLSKIKRASLEKTYEDKKTGAGLGLFITLGASDRLIFELHEKHSTTVRAIINKYKRLKQYKQKQTSIHIYEIAQENKK